MLLVCTCATSVCACAASVCVSVCMSAASVCAASVCVCVCVRACMYAWTPFQLLHTATASVPGWGRHSNGQELPSGCPKALCATSAQETAV